MMNEIKGKADELFDLLENADELHRKLLKIVIGQNHAVKSFVEGYFMAKVIIQTGQNAKGVPAVFLFAGKPGVGKSYLAEEASEIISLPYKRFDMSSYSLANAQDELCGIPNHYNKSHEGLLTGFAREHPECMIVFDEFEKAHLTVIQLFLQVLDTGYLQDDYLGENISFKKAILVFTTNVGKNLYDGEEHRLSSNPPNVILNALKKDINPSTGNPYFPEAVCSRLGAGTIIMFDNLSAVDLIEITDKEFSKNVKSIHDTYGITCNYTTDLIASILYAMGGDLDGRNATAQAKRFFFKEFYELLRLAGIKSMDNISNLKEIKWSLRLEDASDEIKSLYHENGKDTVILIYGSEELCNLDEMDIVECQIMAVSELEEFEEIIHKKDVVFAIVDYCYDKHDDGVRSYLNIEDISSEGKRAFELMKEDCPDIPVFIIETASHKYSVEEVLSLTSNGAADVLSFSVENIKIVQNELNALCQKVCREKALDMLKLRHQVLTFDTAQCLSEDGSLGEIQIFDFRLVPAIEAEDQKSILSAEAKPEKFWSDVIVSDDVKEELQYYINFLSNPEALLGKGAKVPKGLLLYGPPGTGKTSLAKVMATEANVTFLEMSADRFLSKWTGEGAGKVHKVFNTARKYAPAILFLDEIDAIGKVRGAEEGFGHHEILNALLTEMDGFKKAVNKPVFVMAATNFEGYTENGCGLDPALIRRFDRIINIDLPDREDRKKIFELIRDKKTILQISDDEIESLTVRSIGMSPADISSAVETAIRDAIRSETVVNDLIMDEAFEKYKDGEKKIWSDDEIRHTAYHEAGHAFISNYYKENPSYITIVSRSNYGGYMLSISDEDKRTYTKQELLNTICISLGGRAAEMVFFGRDNGLTTGCYSDLRNATDIAGRMIYSYGMDDCRGLCSTPENLLYDNNELRFDVKELLAQQFELARQIINNNKAKVALLAEKLIEKTHLTEKQIQEILS